MAFRFIAGPDDYLVLREARREWEAIAAEMDDENAIEIINGQAGNIDEVEQAVNGFVSAVQTLSLFSPRKAVWFKSITFLGDSITGRAAGTASAVERMQEVLGGVDDATVRVLLSASPVDRRKKAYKWFQKEGNSTFLEGGNDAASLAELASGEAKTAGARFRNRAEAILIEKVGLNARLVIEETRKLCTYLGAEGGDITPRLVTELVPNTAESDFFEAAEAFYQLDLEHTLEAIQRHFFAGNDARPLLSSLQNRNRLLLQLKALEQEGSLRGSVNKSSLARAAENHAARFGSGEKKTSVNIFTQNPWYLGRLSHNLGKLSMRKLLHFQEAFREAFMEIVSHPHHQEGVLRSMAIRCLATG